MLVLLELVADVVWDELVCVFGQAVDFGWSGVGAWLGRSVSSLRSRVGV